MKHGYEVNTISVKNQDQPLTISPMAREDVPSFCTLFQKVFAQPPWNEKWDLEKISSSITKVMQKKGFVGSVAKLGSKPVGYITGYRFLIGPAIFYIDQLFVDESFHGHGIGKALYLNVLHSVDSGGLRGIVLMTKADSPAERFYERAGFKCFFPGVRFRGKVILYIPLQK